MSSSNGPNTVKSGLVLELDAGNTKSYQSGSTTWYNKSGVGNNGTLTNGPTYTTGSYGAIVFDGVDDYVNCGTGITLTGGFTYEVWTKATNFGTNYGVFGQGVTLTNQGLHLIYNMGGRGMIFGMYYNDADFKTYIPTTGVWYQWVFTYNGSTYAKQFYANSVLQTPTSITQNAYVGSGQVNIGATYSNAQQSMNGQIAIARLYNRVLTADEISRNYNANKSRFGLT